MQIKNSLLCLFFGYNLVRWAGATRWMVLRACWNGYSVGMLMTSGGRECVPGPNDSWIE